MIFGLKRKINFWKNHVAKGNLKIFQLIMEFKIKRGYEKFKDLLKTTKEKDQIMKDG